MLSHLRHPNLVLFLGACVDAEPWWVVSEFMEGGSLQDMFEAKARDRGYEKQGGERREGGRSEERGAREAGGRRRSEEGGSLGREYVEGRL